MTKHRSIQKEEKWEDHYALTIQEACIRLQSIAHTTGIIKQHTDEYNAAISKTTAEYESKVVSLQADLAEDEKALMTLMRKNKAVLFDGIDVVNLPPGSLIRNQADHVTIPKTALAECEKQHFDEVIKVVKSLDREMIEKWPDAKLVLIGATRKPKEEFSYNIKGQK